MTNIIDTITTRLQSGDDPFVIARDTGCTTAKLSEIEYESDTPLDDELVAVILPGYSADDGNAEIDMDADSPREAAQEYVDGGEWGEITETSWITVYVWRNGYVLDPDADEVERIQIDRDSHTIVIEPDEPECTADDHDWQSPYSVLGGLKENPGVWGKGGGVVITEVCSHCGMYRVTDSWAQRRDTGEQGLESIEYREADEASLKWIAESDNA